MKEKISGIYKISSKCKPERCYIGSSTNIYKRWNDHTRDLYDQKHHSPKLQNHYNKYKSEDLLFSIIITCSPEELIKNEQFFIDSMNPYFNIAPKAGNCLGKRHTEEAKAKMRASMKGRVPWNKGTKGLQVSWIKGKHLSELTKQKIREWHTGRHPSEESRHKMSERLKGNKHTLGYVATEETRKKISEALRKRVRTPYSEEAKRKMSISQKRAAEERRKRKAEAQEQLNEENCK